MLWVNGYSYPGCVCHDVCSFVCYHVHLLAMLSVNGYSYPGCVCHDVCSFVCYVHLLAMLWVNGYSYPGCVCFNVCSFVCYHVHLLAMLSVNGYSYPGCVCFNVCSFVCYRVHLLAIFWANGYCASLIEGQWLFDGAIKFTRWQHTMWFSAPVTTRMLVVLIIFVLQCKCKWFLLCTVSWAAWTSWLMDHWRTGDMFNCLCQVQALKLARFWATYVMAFLRHWANAYIWAVGWSMSF